MGNPNKGILRRRKLTYWTCCPNQRRPLIKNSLVIFRQFERPQLHVFKSLMMRSFLPKLKVRDSLSAIEMWDVRCEMWEIWCLVSSIHHNKCLWVRWCTDVESILGIFFRGSAQPKMSVHRYYYYPPGSPSTVSPSSVERSSPPVLTYCLLPVHGYCPCRSECTPAGNNGGPNVAPHHTQ